MPSKKLLGFLHLTWRKRCLEFAPPRHSTIPHKPFKYMALKVAPTPE